MLHIHGRRFEITAADERVLNYARQRELPLPAHTALSLRQYFKVTQNGSIDHPDQSLLSFIAFTNN